MFEVEGRREGKGKTVEDRRPEVKPVCRGMHTAY